MVAVGAALRFWQLDALPSGLYPDEAENGINAWDALSGGDLKVFYHADGVRGREGLFVNAIAASFALLGKDVFGLRAVAALAGTLGVLGQYWFSLEFLRAVGASRHLGGDDGRLRVVALCSGLFLALSAWHVEFSHLALRAILVPGFETFGLALLIRALTLGGVARASVAGLVLGLGLHSYIGYRPFLVVVALPVLAAFWRGGEPAEGRTHRGAESPLFLAALAGGVLVASLPLLLYFAASPDQLMERAASQSIFSAQTTPAHYFALNNLRALTSLTYAPECDWRYFHGCPNLRLLPLDVALLAVGLLATLIPRAWAVAFGASPRSGLFPAALRLTPIWWLAWASLPMTLSVVSPHALRGLGLDDEVHAE